jgi:hypothetical protein
MRSAEEEIPDPELNPMRSAEEEIPDPELNPMRSAEEEIGMRNSARGGVRRWSPEFGALGLS